MLSLWANWLVTKFGLNSLRRYLWPVLYTVKPRPEAHMDMIIFEVFLKNIHLIPQDQIV